MSLRERRDILHLAAEGTEGVLVTLVGASGSSYRQAGARLLALPDGRTAGTISGGCLEADLLRKAQWRVRHGAAMHRYDTGFDNDAEIPFGLGCGGVVDLLLEDRNAPETAAVLEALHAHLAGEFRTVVTQLPSSPGGFARIVLDRRGDVLYATESLETDRIVDLRAAARSGAASGVATEFLFIEHLQPAQRLILCGAGEDAKPVARLAASLGWTVLVADGRSQQARPERFPEAHHVHVTPSLHELAPRYDDAVVVMTHSFEQDRAYITELLAMAEEQRPRYIGLLGARHRSALLLKHAADASGTTFPRAIQQVHAPIGLELGGEGPESIALAIVAEMQQALHGPAQGALHDALAAQDHAAAARRMSIEQAEQVLDSIGGRSALTPMCVLDFSAQMTDLEQQS